MDTATGSPSRTLRRRVSQGWRVRNRLRRLALPTVAQEPPIPFGKLGNALLASEADVIAFDIFDTVLRRTITPEHVKRLSIDRLVRRFGLPVADCSALYEMRKRIEAELCRANADVYGELEFRFADMAGELHAALQAGGMAPLPDAASFAAALLDCELAVEQDVLQPVQETRAVLDQLRRSARRLVFISDFYLPAGSLRQLLEGCGIDVGGTRLFVSCDRMASKRSGRLYPDVLRTLGIDAARMTMVGDNAHSDVAMARAAGCASVHVDAVAQHAFYAHAEAGVISASAARDRWEAEVATASDGPDAGMRRVAPSLVLFIERLYAAARQDGIHHLFFLAREGQPLMRLFEHYQAALGGPAAERISCHYLLASRRACYVASLRPLAEEDFCGLFLQYRQISLGEFLASLRVPTPLAEAFAVAIGVKLKTTEADFPTSKTFTQLLALPEFRTLYEELRQVQRANLRGYLDSFGVDFGQHALMLVDVGWKGTIQDFIARALGDAVTVRGYYLGLLSAGQSLVNKQGLLFTDAGGRSPGFPVLAENRSLFEILLCTDHGSALSYERGADGRIAAVLEEAAEETVYIRQEVMPVAEAVLATAQALISLRVRTVVPKSVWHRFVLDCHAKLVFRPWHGAARWLLRAQHRENFGVFRLSSFTDGKVPSLIGRLCYSARLIRHPREQLRNSFWPALTIYLRSGRLLATVYGLRQRRLFMRLSSRRQGA